MILRLTFNDNDYTEYLKEYTKESMLNFFYAKSILTEKEITPRKTMRDIEDALMDYNSSYYKNKLSGNIMSLFIHYLKKDIEVYLRKKFNLDEDTIKYLMDNLEVSRITNLKDQWENGEVVYWFYFKHISIVM